MNDILEQFAREIDTTAEIFERNQACPSVTKNQPPVAGAIKWARSLLARTKQTMSKLLSTEADILHSSGEQAVYKIAVYKTPSPAYIMQ